MPNPKTIVTLTASLGREIVVSALVDPRTLRRYLAHEAVSPMCATRIERALRERGLEHLVRGSPAPAGSARRSAA